MQRYSERHKPPLKSSGDDETFVTVQLEGLTENKDLIRGQPSFSFKFITIMSDGGDSSEPDCPA